MTAATTMLARAEARYDAAIKSGDARKAARAKETIDAAHIHIDIAHEVAERAQKAEAARLKKESRAKAESARSAADAAGEELRDAATALGGQLAAVVAAFRRLGDLQVAHDVALTNARRAGEAAGLVVGGPPVPPPASLIVAAIGGTKCETCGSIQTLVANVTALAHWLPL